MAKVVASPYPEQLHEELSSLGLAPELMEPVQKYPGGMMLYLNTVLFPCSVVARCILLTVHGGQVCTARAVSSQTLCSLCLR